MSSGSIRNSAGRAMFQASIPSRCHTPYARAMSRRLVDQDVERQAGLLDVAAHGLRFCARTPTTWMPLAL